LAHSPSNFTPPKFAADGEETVGLRRRRQWKPGFGWFGRVRREVYYFWLKFTVLFGKPLKLQIK
jgi:hypothetical protein